MTKFDLMAVKLSRNPKIEIGPVTNIQSKLEIIGVKLSKDSSIQQGPARNGCVLESSNGMVICTFF